MAVGFGRAAVPGLWGQVGRLAQKMLRGEVPAGLVLSGGHDLGGGLCSLTPMSLHSDPQNPARHQPWAAVRTAWSLFPPQKAWPSQGTPAAPCFPCCTGKERLGSPGRRRGQVWALRGEVGWPGGHSRGSEQLTARRNPVGLPDWVGSAELTPATGSLERPRQTKARACGRLTRLPGPLPRMGSKSPGSTGQPPAFFSKLTENNSAMVKSKKQEINKKLSTHNRNEPEYSEWGEGSGTRSEPCVVELRPRHRGVAP